jgi:hypothetical protein
VPSCGEVGIASHLVLFVLSETFHFFLLVLSFIAYLHCLLLVDPSSFVHGLPRDDLKITPKQTQPKMKLITEGLLGQFSADVGTCMLSSLMDTIPISRVFR